MANPNPRTDHLPRLDELDQAKSKQIRSEGGKASQRVQAEKKRQRIRLEHLAAQILDRKKLPANIQEIAKHLDADADAESIADAMLLKGAMEGNLDKYKYFKTLLGQDPFINARIKEVSIREKEVNSKIQTEESRVDTLDSLKQLLGGGENKDYSGLGDVDYETEDNSIREATGDIEKNEPMDISP